MRDSYNPSTRRDFRQRYQGTYCWYNGTLVRIQEVGDSKVIFTDAEKFPYSANYGADVQFDFLQVDRGWFNGINDTILLARIPARQYYRGICDSNTAAMRISKTGTLQGRHIDFTTLGDAFKKLPATDVLKDFLKGERDGIALSKHFALTKKGTLFIYNHEIGKEDRETATVTLNDATFEQEVTDAFNRINFSVKVVVK